MCLARQRNTIAERLQEVRDVLDVIVGRGVIRIRPRFDGILAGVDVVSCWRAHRCALKAVRHAHALGRQLIDVGCVGLAAIAADVSKGAVIRNDEQHVGLFGGIRSRSREGTEE